MAGSRKKVLVRLEGGEVRAGYLPSAGLLREAMGSEPELDLLDLEGRLVPLPLGEVRTVAWVRDFNLGDLVNPERLTRTAFLARPRTEGLWVRVAFRGGDRLEGLAGLDVGFLDGVLVDRGVYLIPPDVRSNTQRVYVPRSAMEGLEILGVITTPSKPPMPKRTAAAEEEPVLPGLFPAPRG